MNFNNKENKETIGLCVGTLSIAIVSLICQLNGHSDYVVFYCIGFFVGAWIAKVVYDKKE